MGPKRFLKPKDIAEVCGVGPAGVRVWIRSGKLKAHSTPGGQYRIDPSDAAEFFQKHGMWIPPLLEPWLRKKVLVIDDTLDIQEMIRLALSGLNIDYEMNHAGTGYEGCLLAGSLQPDLIILNLNMSGMNGIDVCNVLKARSETQTVRILAVAASEGDLKSERVSKCGADALLAKPFDVVRLQGEIRDLLLRPREPVDTRL